MKAKFKISLVKWSELISVVSWSALSLSLCCSSVAISTRGAKKGWICEWNILVWFRVIFPGQTSANREVANNWHYRCIIAMKLKGLRSIQLAFVYFYMVLAWSRLSTRGCCWSWKKGKEEPLISCSCLDLHLTLSEEPRRAEKINMTQLAPRFGLLHATPSS